MRSLFLQLNFQGVAVGLGAGLAFALLNVSSRYALYKIEPFTAVFYLFLFGGVFLSFFSLPWIIFNVISLSVPVIFSLTGIVIIAIFLAYILFLSGLSYLEAGKASIAAAIEPAIAILLAFLFLGERLLLPQYLGVLLVLTGIMILSLKG